MSLGALLITHLSSGTIRVDKASERSAGGDRGGFGGGRGTFH
jgi:hypothetical protein